MPGRKFVTDHRPTIEFKLDDNFLSIVVLSTAHNDSFHAAGLRLLIEESFELFLTGLVEDKYRDELSQLDSHLDHSISIESLWHFEDLLRIEWGILKHFELGWFFQLILRKSIFDALVDDTMAETILV